MRTSVYTLIIVAVLAAPSLWAQDQNNNNSNYVPPPIPKAQPADLPTTSTVMRTNSMTVLDDKKRLGPNDYVSFRVVEDRDNESQHLRVNDNGELEVPYAGLIAAQGRTCKQLAYAVKAALEREYYYNATVIIAVERISEKSRGKVYVYGSVRGQGPQEIPSDETYTVSKAIIRAGGFGDFADKKKVKVTRKNGENFVINLKDVIERGKTQDDVVVQPDDQIYVPQRLINM
ncbi:MAG: polysaccharide biosynthesis/export family protein [Chthoniobacterales bacterium]|nr:polysaccharide biosynthesis/export family protein [Chthoniobacterales bacterium]